MISYHQRKAESRGANCESGSGIIRADDYARLAGHSRRAIIESLIEVKGELISRLIHNESPRPS